METIHAIKRRRSNRSFNSQPIAQKLIEELIDCGRLAPTAKNIQPWEFIAITNKQTLQKLSVLAENGRFLAECQCCIAIFSRDTKYYLEDGCAATENILIAAEDLGLSSCWVAGDKKHYSRQVKELLNVPEEMRLVSMIALGHTEVSIPVPSKRPLEEVLHWERFNQ